MQGTVFTFDERMRAGTVVLDSGRRLPFDSEAFDASGLRLLRPGQRLRIIVSGEQITKLTIITLEMPGGDEV